MSTMTINKLQKKQEELRQMLDKQGKRINALKYDCRCVLEFGETEDTELVRLYALHKYLGKHPPGAYIYGLGAKNLHAYHFDYVKYQVFSEKEIRNIRKLSAPINVETVHFRGENWCIKRVTDDMFLWKNGILEKKEHKMFTDKRFYDGIFTPAIDDYGYTHSRGYGAGYGYGYGKDSIHHRIKRPNIIDENCNECHRWQETVCMNCSRCSKIHYIKCKSCRGELVHPMCRSWCLRLRQ